MKSRIQLAGVEHGSDENVLWKGDLPQISGIPGMRIVLNDLEEDRSDAMQFKQVALEIDVNTGHLEQVIYVVPVDRSKAQMLMERLAETRKEGAEGD